MKIAVAGAGAFGTALAVSLSRRLSEVTLVTRSNAVAKEIKATRRNPRLAGVVLPDALAISGDRASLVSADIILLAIPTQQLRSYLGNHIEELAGKHLVACCKGIEITNLEGPISIIESVIPHAKPACLTGPSFADDIALGLPTALTLATKNKSNGEMLQNALTTENIRLYRTTDTLGAELGGALKNVVAIGAGIVIGAGLGDSARAALMARGFSEMQTLAVKLGADPVTLNGLSGFGDLVLTCTSTLSRNFCHGLALGKNDTPDPSKTVEGVKTAEAVRQLAEKHNLELPVCEVIADICTDKLTISEALQSLLSRPLKEE